jgi:hypothetical protein
MVPMYADLWVRAMGFSGSTEIADRIKSRMPEGSDDLKDIPPALVGRFDALKDKHDQAMLALQEAHKLLESDAVKTACQKEIAMIREAVRGKVEKLKLEGKMLELREGHAADERWRQILATMPSLRCSLRRPTGALWPHAP